MKLGWDAQTFRPETAEEEAERRTNAARMRDEEQRALEEQRRREEGRHAKTKKPGKHGRR